MTGTRRVSPWAGPVLTLVAVFLLAMTVLGPIAQSHSGLITKRWIRDTQVEFDFTQSMSGMGANARARITNGAEDWNSLNGNVQLIPRDTVANYSPKECPSTFQKNAMHFGPIDGASKTLAVANTCFLTSTGELHSMQITFDTAENWYTGTGTPPAGQIDLWAVATHELGHTLGIAHFDAADAVCASGNRETMCPFYSPSLRIPASHDIHGFAAVYGGGAPQAGTDGGGDNGGGDDGGQEENTPPPSEPENQPPVVSDVTQRVRQNVPFNGTLTAEDPEGKNVTFKVTGQNFNRSKQSFSLNPNGEWTITAKLAPGTRIFFKYQACDADGECSVVKTVRISVTR